MGGDGTARFGAARRCIEHWEHTGDIRQGSSNLMLVNYWGEGRGDVDFANGRDGRELPSLVEGVMFVTFMRLEWQRGRSDIN